MPRVKRGVVHARRRRRILKQAKGYYGAKSRTYSQARDSVDRALQYAFHGRKRKKRDYRRLWITRINAASREHGLSYSKLIAGLSEAGVGLDRKILAELAVEDPKAFEALAATAKNALA
jgi:large subunit ribosomal protein L20